LSDWKTSTGFAVRGPDRQANNPLGRGPSRSLRGTEALPPTREPSGEVKPSTRESGISRAAASMIVILQLMACSPGDSGKMGESVRSMERAHGLTIERVRIARIGDREGPGVLPEWTGVLVDTRGNFLAFRAAEVVRFDSGGRFDRSFGRPGKGNGEFSSIDAAVLMFGDTLHVLEPTTQRETIVSPELELVRVTPFPSIQLNRAAAGPEGSMVITGFGMPFTRTNQPLQTIHIVRNGSIVRSFGGDTGAPGNTVRVLTHAREGRFWTARLTRNMLELWDTSGAQLRTIERKASWFPRWSRVGGDPNPRPPMIYAVQEDSAGRLWMIVNVVDTLPSERRKELARLDDRYDTIVEVLDPLTGKLLASRRFPEYFDAFAGPGIVATRTADNQASPQFDLWRLLLSPARR
jgi:hypothetical protein